MNHSEREQFWQILCSLPGNDIVAEREQLFKSIKIRSCFSGIDLSAQKAWKHSELTGSIFLLRIIMTILLIPFFTSILKRSGKSI